jgi:hypothetical protein
MSETVTVASRLPVAVLMQTDTGLPGIEARQVIVSPADPGAIDGYGITHGVDAAAFDQWLTAHPEFAAHMAVATQQQIDEHSDPVNTHGFELGFDPAAPPIETPPPVNRDIPYIWQDEQRMRCTMGNWENYPTAYSYQWVQDGTLNIGADNDTLPMLASNDGHTITCVVTASNAAGSTEAPPSNAIVYHAPTVATSAELIGADFTDAELASLITLFNNNSGFALGFDIVVDGLNLRLAATFGPVATGADICAVINAQLGAWLTAAFEAPAAPWQFLIRSDTAGVTSTISYASAPSTAAAAGSVGALMASVGLRGEGPLAGRPTQDLSIPMKLRQSVGAITVQGIDATTP